MTKLLTECHRFGQAVSETGWYKCDLVENAELTGYFPEPLAYIKKDLDIRDDRKFDLENLNLDPQRCFYKNDRGPEKPCKYKFTQIPQAWIRNIFV